MNNLSKVLSSVGTISAIFALLTIVTPFNISFAEYEESQTTTITALDDELSIEETVMTLVIPENNTLPWAFVEGMIENPAPGYPVIIQFFNDKSGDDPMHVAQVDVNDDDTYEYKFRVRDVDIQTGQTINIFEGTYAVKVFKVIVSTPDNLGST
ncbi:hypothetical protein [Nitrosopumilus sp.]|uniref:hypothetical protein n=1 Tax=Nitrosopumilus sp. TaxID=2024843 RepID=UPI00292E7957|nr:hypothetical protein [Nitrosopumilus sp.]